VTTQRIVVLPATGRAAGLARQAARDALSAWRLAYLEETAVLLVSELVGNVLRHARTGVLALALYLEPDGSSLKIEVHDADPHEPRPRTPGGLDESGFGFVLIEALAGKWGVRQTATGKAVWVELDARQAADHPAPGCQPPVVGDAGQARQRGA
jgi:anti-sigma regulatory factor (Ser/Thr protein kinase)